MRTLPRDRLAIVLPDDHPPAAGPPEGSPLRPAQLRDESWVTILPGHAAREQLDGAATRPASARSAAPRTAPLAEPVLHRDPHAAARPDTAPAPWRTCSARC